MSDAYECDRCGELQGGPPEMKVATTVTDVGGYVRVKERKSEPAPISVTRSQPIPPNRSRSQTTRYKAGDLCEDCADELAEWWNEAKEARDS